MSKKVELSQCPIIADITKLIEELEKDLDINYKRVYYDDDNEEVTAIIDSAISSLKHHRNLLNILRSDENKNESIYGF